MAEHFQEHDYLPRWNGDAAGFKRYQQEVRIYKLRKDLSKEVSYAAELIVGLTGPARTCALQSPEEDLWPHDTLLNEARANGPPDGEEEVIDPVISVRSINLRAIDLLTRRLERELMSARPIREANAWSRFSARINSSVNIACA